MGAYTHHTPGSRCTTQGCPVEGTVEGALTDAMRTKPAATITVASLMERPADKLSLEDLPMLRGNDSRLTLAARLCKQ